MLGEAGEGKALHQSAQRVAHLPVDAALGGRGELLRHQQDALLPASARARMRWYSRVVFPLPEPPKSSFNMVNLSVGSVFYRGRLALIFLSLYHKIAATSILWYNEEKIISERGHLHENFSSRLRRQPHRPRHLRPHRVPDFPHHASDHVKARDKVAARVCEVAKEIEAELIVIGLPLNMDGTEGERARKSRKLAKTVEIWSGLPVRMWDERQTTCAAADLLDESGTFGAKRKSILDSVSATVILDDYLAWRKEHPGEV